MKKLRKALSVSLVICMLMAILPKVLLADDVTVEDVKSQLEAIDTLQEMQDARENFKASGSYSDATAENHKLKRAEYEQYLADMFKAREEAAEAYAALSAEEQNLIDDELVAKLGNELDTTWNDVSYTVSDSVRDYQFQAVYPAYAYELSNHMASKDGGLNNEIPQTLVLVDTNKNSGAWSPNGQYSFGKSNYEVVYCCDAENGVEDGTLYQRVNLEDSTYYDAEAAEHIRAIVSNSYPYLSLEEMKSNLEAANFPYAEQLTRSDIIAAVQMAIWNYANGGETSGAEYKYSRTFDLNANTQWGKGIHDYTNELWDWWSVGKRHLTVNKEVGERVDKLAKYLAELKGEMANTNQIVINEVKIEGTTPIQAKKDAYNVALKVLLNNGATSEQDNIVMTVKTSAQTITQEVKLGTAEYNMMIEAKAGETITVLVEGKQTLPKGAYLYEPQPADNNGDGVATAREVSQILVGVAEGVTNIEATDSITLDIPETNPITTNLKLQKTDEKGEALTGAGFNLYFLGEDATYNIGTYFVDGNGALVVENLFPGNYELVESVVSEGYLEPEEPIAFSIDGEGVLTLADSADAELVDGVVVIKNYPPSVNTPLGSIEITKTDIDTDETLEDAEFRLTNQEGDVVDTLTTDENGKVTFKDLPYGEYKLEETKAPEGYVLNKESKIIKINDNAQNEKYTYTNKPITGSAKVVKTDESGTPVAGAEFTLMSGEKVDGKATTNAEGIAEFTGLSYGVEYTVTETKAPEGYVLNEENTHTFTITKDGQVVDLNSINIAVTGSLQVTKVDTDSKEPLAGAEFTLTDAEGDVVATKTTDKNGVAVFHDLAYGVEYKITETKAPAGYLLSEEATDTFTILEHGQKEEFTYENTRENSSLAVEKTVDKNQAIVGETVTYTIVVTNTGNTTLKNVGVKDNLIGLDSVIDQLAVNESRTLLGEYVVTADDIGELENIATATVEGDGESITHEASVIVEVSAKAEAAVDAADQVINPTQNPQTGDTTINTLLVLLTFVLAGSGLYIFRRKYRA